jgi:hypothetical protein
MRSGTALLLLALALAACDAGPRTAYGGAGAGDFGPGAMPAPGTQDPNCATAADAPDPCAPIAPGAHG